MKKIFVTAALLLAVAACTDAKWARMTALGDAARVTCHSGGKVVFDDFSTGKVMNDAEGDGYQFVTQSQGDLVEVTGECVVAYGAKKSADFRAVRP